MKSRLKLRSAIAAFGSTALLATGLAVATPAHAGICSVDATTGVETCVSTLKDGAQYKFMVPTKNYNGTMFFWSHGSNAPSSIGAMWSAVVWCCLVFIGWCRNLISTTT